ncbi:MAG TPA: hypothetical protein VK465_18670, partial [Fibrobacteria bacterium]|nr:hypothetical protein [Fibrobacteria bacterium]
EASRSKPWSRWETGVRRQWLHVQYKRARRYVDPGYCLGTTDEEASCLACTACETQEEMTLLTGLRRKHEPDADGFDGRRKAFRQSSLPVTLEVRWTDRVLGLPRKYPGLVLASALMRAESSLALHFWRFAGSAAPASRDLCWVAGRDRITLEWLPEGEALLRERLADPVFLAAVDRALGPWGRLLGAATSDGVEEGQAGLAGQAGQAGLAMEYLVLSPFRPDPDAYALHLGLRFTLRRQAEGFLCEWSKDSLRKRVLTGLTWRETRRDGETLWEARVQPGPKFDPEEFLRKGFRLEEPDDWARIACYSVRPGEAALDPIDRFPADLSSIAPAARLGRA